MPALTRCNTKKGTRRAQTKIYKLKHVRLLATTCLCEPVSNNMLSQPVLDACPTRCNTKRGTRRTDARLLATASQRRLQTTQAHACEHALASGLLSRSAETHTDSLKRRSSCQDHEELQIIALPLSCHHTKMKRSQRPRAFAVPNKSCRFAHVRVTAAPATPKTKKTIFQALPAPLLAHKKPGLVIVYGDVSAAKAKSRPSRAVTSKHTAHLSTIQDWTCVLLFSQSPYISTTRHIYIYI